MQLAECTFYLHTYIDEVMSKMLANIDSEHLTFTDIKDISFYKLEDL